MTTIRKPGLEVALRRPVLRALFQVPAWFYRLHGGWLLGQRFLLLCHTGRRSGRRHGTVLEVVQFRPDTDEAIVMSARGSRADWLRNIQAVPDAEVSIGSRRFSAAFRILHPGDAETALADYISRNRWMAPIVRAGLGWILGWRFDGTPAAVRRAAAQVPFVAFRPRAG